MRQAIIKRPWVLEIVEAAAPEPRVGELVVRSSVVGVSESDVQILVGTHPFADTPVVPGNEVAGVVEAVGPGAQGFSEGDRVFLEPHVACGLCYYCGSGRVNLCEEVRVVGAQLIGGLGDAFAAPASRFHLLPAGMSMSEAALVEPLAVATHAVRIAGDLRGAAVAVLGAGSKGILTMLAAKAAGASAIVVADPHGHQCRYALQLGASAVFDPTKAGVVKNIRDILPHRPDVIFDCVGTQGSTDQAVSLAEKGGTVTLVGVPRGLVVEVALHIIQDAEIRLQGSGIYLDQDVLRATELIRNGTVQADRIVTATYPLEEAAEAFEVARCGRNLKVQVVLENDEPNVWRSHRRTLVSLESLQVGVHSERIPGDDSATSILAFRSSRQRS